MIYLFRSKKEDYTLRQQYIPTGVTELDFKVYYYNNNGILQSLPIFVGKIYGATDWTIPLTDILSSLFDNKLTKPLSYINYDLAVPRTSFFSTPNNMMHYLLVFSKDGATMHEEDVIYVNNTNVMSLNGLDHPEMNQFSLDAYNLIGGMPNNLLYTGLRRITIPWATSYIVASLTVQLHYKNGTTSRYIDTGQSRDFPIWYVENDEYNSFCEICIDRAMLITTLQWDSDENLSEVSSIDVYLATIDENDEEGSLTSLCSFDLLDNAPPPIFKDSLYQLVYYTLDGVFTSIYCTGASSSSSNCKMQSYMDSKGIRHNFYGTNEETITVNTGLLTDTEAKFVAGLSNSQTVFIRPVEYRCDKWYTLRDSVAEEMFIPIQYYARKKSGGNTYIDWEECTVTSQFKSHRYRDNRKFSQYTINLKLNNVQNTI